MMSTDLFRRRANECRHLAAKARNANDKAFWLGLVERWEAARQRCLKQVLAGEFDPPGKNKAPAGEVRQPGLSPARNSQLLSTVR
jgi:hypothetical protein